MASTKKQRYIILQIIGMQFWLITLGEDRDNASPERECGKKLL